MSTSLVKKIKTVRAKPKKLEKLPTPSYNFRSSCVNDQIFRTRKLQKKVYEQRVLLKNGSFKLKR